MVALLALLGSGTACDLVGDALTSSSETAIGVPSIFQFEPSGWVRTGGGGADVMVVTEIPPNGSIPIPARFEVGTLSDGAERALGVLLVDVRGPDGNAVSGLTHYSADFGRLWWKADEPLSAGLSYDVEVTTNNAILPTQPLEDFEFRLDVRIAAESVDPTVPAVTPGTSSLTEGLLFRQVCCRHPRFTLCHDGTCANCVSVPHYGARAQATWSIGRPFGQIAYRVTHEDTGHGDLVVPHQTEDDGERIHAEWTHNTSAETYCLQLEWIDGLSPAARNSSRLCVDASALQPLADKDPPPAPQVTESTCQAPDRCRIGERPDHGWPVWGVLVGLVLLSLRTRRRRA